MLPPFIIEQIRKREQEREHRDSPRLELPLPMPPPSRRHPGTCVPDDDADRGVIIVDLGA
ncbi:MAG: hypothetical protein NVS3B20_12200 [Polyangiales bacterium]